MASTSVTVIRKNLRRGMLTALACLFLLAPRLLRLARACARQAQRTGSALWKAKAEALAGAMITAQFPTTGQIPCSPDVNATLRLWGGPGFGDGGSRGEYSTMALLDLAALWEPVKP